MTTRRLCLLVCLALCSPALRAQSITGVSGTVANGQTITLTGTSFGANASVVQIFDDFEGGTAGTAISTSANTATIHQWDAIDTPSSPQYSTTIKVSGSKSMRSDFTTDSSSSVQRTISPKASDVFATWWVQLPTASTFPGGAGGGNWKMTWLFGSPCCSTSDQMWPISLGAQGDSNGAGPPYGDWFISCNACTGDVFTGSPLPRIILTKGKWMRFAGWMHATNSGTSVREFWGSSPSTESNLAFSRSMNNTTAVFAGAGPYFDGWLVGAYGWQSGNSELIYFDDVYMATGADARARVEICEASTYAACKNITICPVTSWSDTSIQCVVRPGMFQASDAAFVYVHTAADSVSGGSAVTFGQAGGGGGAAPRRFRVLRTVSLFLLLPPLICVLPWPRRKASR